MTKRMVACALALATGLMVSAVLTPPAKASGTIERTSAVQLTERHVALLRAALNLRTDQHRYWAPVEAALVSVVRQQRGDVRPETVHRVTSAAKQLIHALDWSQRRTALSLIRQYGFDRLAVGS